MPMNGVDLTRAQRDRLDQALVTGDEDMLLIHDLRVSRALVAKGVIEPLTGEGSFPCKFRLTEIGKASLGWDRTAQAKTPEGK